MVVAKLDQSRVLVTKFRQNLSTLKGRRAGQRHTDRQTNSAEGPFSFAIGPKNSTFLAAPAVVKSEPYQTWHGDRRPRARSCTAKTFGV